MKKIFKNEVTQTMWEIITENSGINYNLFNTTDIAEIEKYVDNRIEFKGCYWSYGAEIEDYLYSTAYHKEVIQPMIASNKMKLDAIARDNEVNMGYY